MQLKIGQKVRYKEEWLRNRPHTEIENNVNEFTVVNLGDKNHIGFIAFKTLDYNIWWEQLDYLEPIPEPKEEGETWQDRWNKLFYEDADRDESSIRYFIQSELDLALQAERERIISLIKE